MNGRVLGLDFGGKTLGVAVSDALGWTANPLETIRRADENDLDASIARLRQIIKDFDVKEIALGYPKHMNNSEGERCAKTLAFKRRLEEAFPQVTVALTDERLTTALADRIMLEADLSRGKRARKIDALAASLILDVYLNTKNNNNIRKGVIKLSKNINENKNDELLEDGELEDAFDVITMTDEDGNDTEFYVIDETKDGGNTYLLLAEAESFDDEESEATIFRLAGGDDDNAVYEEIEDDAEFERVVKLFTDASEDYALEV